jgi:hypothetical protein
VDSIPNTIKTFKQLIETWIKIKLNS